MSEQPTSSIRLFVLKWTPDTALYPEAKEMDVEGAAFPDGTVVVDYPDDEYGVRVFRNMDRLLYALNEFGTPGEPVYLNEAVLNVGTHVSEK